MPIKTNIVFLLKIPCSIPRGYTYNQLSIPPYNKTITLFLAAAYHDHSSYQRIVLLAMSFHHLLLSIHLTPKTLSKIWFHPPQWGQTLHRFTNHFINISSIPSTLSNLLSGILPSKDISSSNRATTSFFIRTLIVLKQAIFAP